LVLPTFLALHRPAIVAAEGKNNSATLQSIAKKFLLFEKYNIFVVRSAFEGI
jgi:hypothetical protein